MMKLRKLRCSFCRKSETQVLKLVAGPHVYICDKCVAIASEIMSSDPHDESNPPKVEPTVWRKCLTGVQRLLLGDGARQVSSLRVAG